MAMNFHVQLGGLMGASPYSNMSILDAAVLQQRFREQRHLLPLLGPQFRQSESDQISTTPIIKFSLPNQIIQELLCRFIMNIPEEEKFDPVRALFQVELAHWFFIDNYCMGEQPDPCLRKLTHIPFNQFAYIMFKAAPHLQQYFPEVDKHLAEFRSYRSRVPTFGAILMDQALKRVVLVQGFRNQWGFPKGKVNEVEDPVECAIREVFEETGYNMRKLINPNHFIESKTRERNDRLYLIRGVDPNFPFNPQTQFEIKNIAWFNIDELPQHKKDTNPKILHHGHAITNFFTVYPYIKRLRYWIADKVDGKNKIDCYRSKGFDSDTEEEDSYSYSFQTLGTSPGNINTTLQFMNPNSSSRQRGVSTVAGNQILKSVLGSSSGKENAETVFASKKGAKIKKRLFTDEPTPNPTSDQTQQKNVFAANLISSAIGIPITSKTKGVESLSSMKAFKEPKNFSTHSNLLSTRTYSGKKSYPILDHYDVIAPSWTNFKFDTDRILRAFKGERI